MLYKGLEVAEISTYVALLHIRSIVLSLLSVISHSKQNKNNQRLCRLTLAIQELEKSIDLNADLSTSFQQSLLLGCFYAQRARSAFQFRGHFPASSNTSYKLMFSKNMSKLCHFSRVSPISHFINSLFVIVRVSITTFRL